MPTAAGDDALPGLAEVVDELYVLPPADFTGRREELAKQARSAGDKALTAALRRLKRPTTSAWALNLLSRQETDLVGQLLELGESLRQAQAGLDGAALRELDKQRRGVVGALARRAGALAAEHGHTLDAELSRQVEQSLGAALADPDAGAAVASGQLTRPVSVVGFGVEVDPDAVAVPALVLVRPTRGRGRSKGRAAGDDPPETSPRPKATAGKATAGKTTSRTDSLADARARRERERRDQERRARRAEARATLEAARAAETEAERAAQDAATQVADLRARLDELRVEREELAARLAECEEQTARTTARLTEGEEQQDEADQAVLAARRARSRAEREAEAEAAREP